MGSPACATQAAASPFRPCLPAEWKALRFCLVIQGARLHVEVLQSETRYMLEEGRNLSIRHLGEEHPAHARLWSRSRSNPQPPAEEPVSDFEPSEGSAGPDVGDAAEDAGIIPRAP